MKGNIYKIFNDVNDKVYIGKTLHSIEKRFAEHIADSKRKRNELRPLYAAMNKYGIEHFHVELIETVDSTLLNEREKYWIQQYNSYHYGYNATYGGDGKILYDEDIRQEMIIDYKNGMLISEIAVKYHCDISIVHDALSAEGISTTINSHTRLMIGIAAYKNDQLIKTFKSHKAAGQWLYENGYTQSQNWDNISATLGRARKNPDRTAYGFKWKEIGE